MSKQAFGATLKKIRQSKHMSQKAICEGLCSQPMLSAIENGKYMPNSQLLIGLCQRLGIQADTLVLQDHFSVSSSADFSQQAEHLCNQHAYPELKAFLESPTVLDSIETAAENQAYYYYLGSSEFHLDSSLLESESAFKLVLAEESHPSQPTTLSRLALGSLGLIYAKKQLADRSHQYATESLANITEAIYEENLNILFYFKAYGDSLSGRFVEAVATIDEGIAFITAHRSSYMLANLYYLLATISEGSATEEEVTAALQRSEIFAELYHERVFKG